MSYLSRFILFHFSIFLFLLFFLHQTTVTLPPPPSSPSSSTLSMFSRHTNVTCVQCSYTDEKITRTETETNVSQSNSWIHILNWTLNESANSYTMFSKLNHPCDLPMMTNGSDILVHCGICGRRTFDWNQNQCSICPSKVQVGRSNLGTVTGIAQTTYEFFQWRIASDTQPKYQRKQLKLMPNANLDEQDTKLIVNLNVWCVAGVSTINWSQSLDEKDLKKHERLAKAGEYCNWSHKIIIGKIIEIGKLFVGTRSIVSLLTLLIEIGQLTRDMMSQAILHQELREAISSFASAMTTLMADAEMALRENRRVECLNEKHVRTLETIRK